MLWGYCKKMVIADRASIFVGEVYQNATTAGGTELLIASFLYTVQIYADFSGCVDIARGVAELFGIELAENFRVPYFSTSINEFWRRWHISLSSWFRDYVYIPLGGNRKGTIRRWLNVMIVFFLSGIWHGAGWTYIIWGMLHGVYQVIGAILDPLKAKIKKAISCVWSEHVWRGMEVIVTFCLVNFAWIFFRAENISVAKEIIQGIFLRPSPWILTDGTLYTFGIERQNFFVLMMFIVVLIVVDYMHYKKISIRDRLAEQSGLIRWIIYYVAIFAIILWGAYGSGYNVADFIYMNF
jgi:D-alanyl-lipoteichoic acid acyltransferase DltB (MBOAT superfamily)